MKTIIIDNETNMIIHDSSVPSCGTGSQLYDIQNPVHIETFKDVKKIWVKIIG